MGFKITKQFSFEAAHHLVGLRPGHQCGRQHGHSYRVEIELTSLSLSGNGFVVDYGNLDELGDFLKGYFDHKDLNEVFQDDYFVQEFGTDKMNTTAENIAMVLFWWSKRKWSYVSAVRVSETLKTWAEYRSNND